MNERVAVIGFGVTGESVVRHLLRQSAKITVIDTRAPRAVDFSGVEFLWNTQHWPSLSVDYAVVSPGLSMDSSLVAGARASGVKLVSDIDLFFQSVTVPVIGVTGTNGKSTVTSLVGHLLQSQGFSCGIGGNIGVAALDIIDARHEVYVLELSSFQLERSELHRFYAAAILNVTQDHLDQHQDMACYLNSKRRIYARAERVVYSRSDDRTCPPDPRIGITFGEDIPPTANDWGIRTSDHKAHLARGHALICALDDLPLAGAHNHQNVLAACALVDTFVAQDSLAQPLMMFDGLRHRFEKVAEIDKVAFVNDSKATNPGATLAALKGIPKRNQVILIAGGQAKGADLQPLKTVLKDRVRHLFTLGSDGPQLEGLALQSGIMTTAVSDIEQAVILAKRLAGPGDLVLLSPACASLDMFISYAERGDRFTEAVRAINTVEGAA